MRQRHLSEAVRRGFDAGDDDKLQAAALTNLRKLYAQYIASGNMEEARRVKEQLDALEHVQRIDLSDDPDDQLPDDPEIG